MTIEYIVHISDLHINKFNHNNLFYALRGIIDVIKDVKNTILVITGDIFDKKTGLTTEDINLFKNFLKRLFKKNIKTIFTIGNHDYVENIIKKNINLNNVSVLMENQYENIVCLLKTGSYCYKNLCFYNYSCFDKELPDLKSIPEPLFNSTIDDNHTKIALLHETIVNVKLDNGTNLLNGRLKASDLMPWDMVLMGDIHKHQFMAPHIAYAGSLVQNHIGESYNQHGYILWNVNLKSGVFYNIPCKEISLVLRADNDQYEKINIHMDQVVRELHVKYANCSNKFISNMREELKIKYNINPILRCEDIDTKLINNEISSLSHNEVIHKLLIKFNEVNYYDDIINIHQNFIDSKCSHIQNVKWTIKYLEWDNIMTYGTNNYINFEGFQGLTTIIGRNEVGKSTIFDIISKMIINSTLRGGTNNEFIKDGKKNGRIICTVQIGNDEYHILHIYTRNRTLEIKIYKNDEPSEIEIDNKYEYLKNKIGFSNDMEFNAITMASQDRSSWVSLTPIEVHKRMCRISRIENINDIKLEVKRNLKKLDGEILELSDHRDIAIINNDIINNENSIKINNESNINFQENLKILNQKLNNCYKKLISKQIDDINIADASLEVLENMRNNIIIENFDADIDVKALEHKIIETEVKIKYLKQELKSGLSYDECVKITDGVINEEKRVLNPVGKCENITDEENVILQIKTIHTIPFKTGLSYKQCKEIQDAEVYNVQYPTEVEEAPKVKKVNQEIFIPRQKRTNLTYDECLKLSNFDIIRYKKLNLHLVSTNMTFNSKCDDCNKNKSYIGNTDYKKTKDEVYIMANDGEIYEDAMFDLNEYKNDELIIQQNNYEKYKKYKKYLIDLDEYNRMQENIKQHEYYLNAQDDIKQYENNILIHKQNEIKLKKESYDNYIKYINDKEFNYKIDAQNDIIIYEKYLLLNKKLIKYKQKLNDYLNYYKLEDITFNIVIKNKINKLTQQINAIDIIQPNHILFELRAQLNIELENSEKALEKLNKKIDERKLLSIYNNCIIAENGIFSILFNKLSLDLTKRCNAILNQITTFSIVFEYDSSNFNIIILKDTHRISAKLGSGFQKFIIDIVIRIALSEISQLSSSTTLYIDEGFGCLDEINLTHMISVLETIKQYKPLVIISHLQELLQFADQQIVIDKHPLQFGNKNKFKFNTMIDLDKEDEPKNVRKRINKAQNDINNVQLNTPCITKVNQTILNNKDNICHICRPDKPFNNIKTHLQSKKHLSLIMKSISV